ncbi:MAG: DUF5317 domain-containing protein [Chloroflexi bacterium]|nr:DUF5317 domain-containing protein [Chloroflexota bacterium]
MILLLALVAGLLVGLEWARWHRRPYQIPELRYLWLVFAAFLPQLIIIYLPLVRVCTPDWLAAASLLASQVLLLGFAFLNRRLPGMSILLLGSLLNLVVIAANGGFMPISPQTAGRLVPKELLLDISTGARFGTKDILLHPQETRLEWLADRFLPPAWFPYQVAFSLGDVFLAIGVFWLLAFQKAPKPYTNAKPYSYKGTVS